MALEHCFVVPAHGDSPFLSDCLRSLRGQTVASHVVATTSTPSAFISQAATAHGAHVLVNPERAGIASDWNFALRVTTARYVTLAHQDDTYAPEFLARTLDLFGKHEGALCFTGYQEIDDLGRPKVSKTSRVKHLIEWATIGRREVPTGGRLRAFVSFGNPLPCSSVTFDRERLANFAFAANYASNLDWDAWCRLLDRGETFLHVPDRLVGRRHNPLTATARLIRDGRRQKEDLMMFRRLWPRPLSDLIAYVYRAGY
jgi:hypothetical protein